MFLNFVLSLDSQESALASYFAVGVYVPVHKQSSLKKNNLRNHRNDTFSVIIKSVTATSPDTALAYALDINNLVYSK